VAATVAVRIAEEAEVVVVTEDQAETIPPPLRKPKVPMTNPMMHLRASLSPVVFDSGATNHFSSARAHISGFTDAKSSETVKTADGGSFAIAGTGTLDIKVPDLPMTLLSIGKLDDAGVVPKTEGLYQIPAKYGPKIALSMRFVGWLETALSKGYSARDNLAASRSVRCPCLLGCLGADSY